MRDRRGVCSGADDPATAHLERGDPSRIPTAACILFRMPPAPAPAAYANIGPRGCKRRSITGWGWLLLGAALVVLFTIRAAPTWVYLITAIPFLLGTLGYYQSREQVCVFHAALNQRDMDGGAEKVTSPGELSVMRRHAAHVWGQSLVGALVLTGIAMLVALLRR